MRWVYFDRREDSWVSLIDWCFSNCGGVLSGTRQVLWLVAALSSDLVASLFEIEALLRLTKRWTLSVEEMSLVRRLEHSFPMSSDAHILEASIRIVEGVSIAFKRRHQLIWSLLLRSFMVIDTISLSQMILGCKQLWCLVNHMIESLWIG